MWLDGCKWSDINRWLSEVERLQVPFVVQSACDKATEHDEKGIDASDPPECIHLVSHR